MSEDEYKAAIDMLSKPDTVMAGLKALRELAEDGDTRAMCDYGRLFDTPGAPVTQNGEEAFKWYLQAAEYGDDRGQFYVGESYYQGRIVPRNYIQATKWFTLSAEKGYAIAQYYLGHMYYYGNGVPIDEREAMRWFFLSVDRECNEARVNLGDLYCKEKTFEYYSKAYNLYHDAAMDGYAPAFYKLGLMNYEGKGRPPNYTEALKNFRKGAEKENGDCYYMLGLMYYEGIGILKDTKMGVRYMLLAESEGNESAKEYLDKIDHTRKNGAKWGGGSNLIPVEQIFTPDLISRPPRENIMNRSVSEEPVNGKKVGFLGRLFKK